MNMPVKKKIAILGATSHIAKGLIYNFCRHTDKYDLYLFARSPERVQLFLNSIANNNKLSTQVLEEFKNGTCDVVVNCIGIGQPAKFKKAVTSIFVLTEHYDNLILEYLEKNPHALCINFSSGAVYGKCFPSPVEESSTSIVDVNHIEQNDYYRIAKINSEAKHRTYSQLNIVDLRVFAYFSRFIDIESQYFMTELASCVKSGKEFITTRSDMTRDFIHPLDLFSLVEKCIEMKRLNDVYDVYSQKPVTKFEILDYFSREYALKVTTKDTAKSSSPTGSKEHYYSNNRRAQHVGYAPRYTSMDCIIHESKALLTNDKMRTM